MSQKQLKIGHIMTYNLPGGHAKRGEIETPRRDRKYGRTPFSRDREVGRSDRDGLPDDETQSEPVRTHQSAVGRGSEKSRVSTCELRGESSLGSGRVWEEKVESQNRSLGLGSDPGTSLAKRRAAKTARNRLTILPRP